MNYPAPKGSHSRNSRIFSSRIVFSTFAALVLLALIATSVLRNPSVGIRTALAGGFSGAIYTSTSNGDTVNANLYTLKDDVYLNGGPQNDHGGVLPDGTYYFEVTNPNGGALLSTDPAACRQLTVTNGVVSGYAAGAVPNTCTPHANGPQNLANLSIPVQLTPFMDTPNAGGEYKVYLIEQGDGTTIDQDGLLIHRSSSNDKSDNFKIKQPIGPPQSAIGGVKWIDTNHDGVLDLINETGRLEGIEIDITFAPAINGQTTATTHTAADGSWGLAFPVGTTYTACEVVPTGYTQTGPNSGAQALDLNSNLAATANSSRCWEGTVNQADTSSLHFGNIDCEVTISCPDSVTRECGSDTSPTSTGTATATDNCGDATIGYSDSFVPGSCANTGVITRTWTATDPLSGKSKTCDQTITIVDTTAPTIGNAGPRGTIYCPSTPVFTAPTATDSCSTATVSVVSDVTTPGSCSTYSRTITWQAHDACGNLSGTRSQTIEVRCNTCGEGTMGYWQNKNGQTQIISAGPLSGTCNLTPSLRAYAPFQDLSATASCSQVFTYVTNVVKAASSSGAAMNAMLKAQMLSTTLDVYFIKVNGAAPIDLTYINKAIGSTSYENVSSSFGGASCKSVVNMLAYAASQSNSGGSIWYGQVKSGPNSQELAKDAFDAINNQKAFSVFSCP